MTSHKPTKGQPLGQSRVAAARNGPRVPVFAVAIGVLVVVLIGAIVGIVVLGGDDETSDGVEAVGDGAPIDDGGATATLPPGQEAFGDVEVEGDDLPEYDKEADDDPAVGEPAPKLTGIAPNGDPVTIDSSTGPQVVVFLAHWCPHCQAEVPRIVDLASQSPDGTTIEGVPFSAVLTASDPNVENFPPGEWLTEEGWPAPALLDNEPESGQIPDAFRAYGVSGFPFMVAIDADGNVADRSSGELGEEGLQEFFAQVAG